MSLINGFELEYLFFLISYFLRFYDWNIEISKGFVPLLGDIVAVLLRVPKVR